MPGASGIRRRIVAYRAVLTGCCVALAVVTLGLTALTSYLGDAAIAGVRSTLSAGPVAGTFVSYTTTVAADEKAQAVAGVVLLGRSFGKLPATVHRAVTTGAIGLTRPGKPGAAGSNGRPVDRTFELRATAGPQGLALVVAGRWPRTTGSAGDVVPVAVPSAAAALLGLRLGDILTPSNGAAGAVRIVAVVTPLPGAAAEFEPLPGDDRTVADRATASVLLTDEAGVRRLVPGPAVVWTVTPTVAAIEPTDVEPMRLAAAETRRLLNNDAAINVQGVSESGALAATLDSLARSLAAVRAAAAAPLLLVGSFGLFLLVEMSALVARARRPEVALLAARGLSPRTVAAQQLVESTIIAVPAVLIGWSASLLLRKFVGPGRAAPDLPPWWPATACALVVLVSAVLFGWRDARRAPSLPARAPGLSTFAPAVVVVGAAAVSLWRFLRVGSAVLVVPDGPTSLDPVALPAPALLLLAFAVGVGLVAVLGAALAARLAARRAGIGLVLSARQVSRRPTAFGGVALLTGLAVAFLTVSAGYGPSRERLADLAAVLTTGGDLRVQLPAGGATTPQERDPAVPFRALGARQATSVLASPVEIGSLEAELTAAPASSLSGLTPAAAEAYDPAAVAAALSAGRLPGLPLPRGTRSIELDLQVTAFTAPAGLAAPAGDGGSLPPTPSPAPPPTPLPITVVIWLATGDGPVLALRGADLLVPVTAGNSPDPLRRTVTVEVPPDASPGPASIAALDTELQAAGRDTIDTVSIADIRADTSAGTGAVRIPPTTAWTTPPLDGQNDLQLQTGGPGTLSWGGRVPPSAAAVTVRLMPAQPERSASGPAIPVVVNRALADRLGAQPGASLDFRLAGTDKDLQVVVAAISPVLPGPAGGLLAVTDLAATTEQFLRTTVLPPGVDEVRLSGAAGQLGAGVLALAGPDAVVTVAANRTNPVVVGPATTALWAGSGLSVLLAVLAMAAAMAGQLAERRDEAAPLLAAGLSRKGWLGGRRREFAGIVGVAACLGIAAGVAANQLTTGRLARSAVVDAPDGLTAAVALSPALWAGLLVAALSAVAVLFAYGRFLGRQWDRVTR